VPAARVESVIPSRRRGFPVRKSPWFAVAIIAALGCSKSPPQAGQSGDPGPVKVKVAVPKAHSLRWTIEQPATVEPFEVTPLVGKLPAYVQSVEADPRVPKGKNGRNPEIDIGSEVALGQLLATLDIPELDAEATQKAAAVARAKAEHLAAEKEVTVITEQAAAARAAVKEAVAGVARAETDVARWKAELDQVTTQITGGVADAQSRIVATKSWDAAKAAKSEAEARVETAKALARQHEARQAKSSVDLAATAERVKEAEADAARVETLRGYKRIVAPFAGIVTARNAYSRTYVHPAGDPLFVVARADRLRVVAEIPGSAAEHARVGAAAVVSVASPAGREYPAPVARTKRVRSPESRTLRIEIDLDNPDRALAPGVYATVRIAATTEAMAVPSGCILAADETFYAFLVEEGKAVKYRLQLGRSDGGNVQVLSRRKAATAAGNWEPFAGTEQVVNGNLGALADGTPVVTQ
jgi:RND family efflux transporter MFP subunit